jgi:probable rRNA maturation factor
MEPLVDTVIEDPGGRTACHRWPNAPPAPRWPSLGLDPAGFQIVVMGCDDARIATLNTEFRGKPAPTNVLSWPSEDRAAETPATCPSCLKARRRTIPEELGDIAIAWETCAGARPPIRARRWKTMPRI